jgi:ankyrin repeat protein
MRFEIFNQVLERKETDANLFDLKHRTAMFLAVESKDLQIMESLKKAGALIDWKDNEGRTPLSLAAELGHLETLKFLFEKGHAKIDLHDDLHRTPLQWAITSGSTDIVRYLLANAADVNHRDLHHRTPLFLAVELDSFQVKEEIINLLIERGANPNLAGDEEKTPLIHAVLQSDIATVKQLLDPKYSTVNVNQYAEGRTALSLAIEHGSTEIIKMLIPKAEVNMEDDNSLKRTPLAWAIEKGNFWATMELLEDNRTDVHRPNPHGRTPFSLAAGKERVAIMQLLIRHGADPHWEDNDHHTGFWWFLKARSDYAFSMSIDLRKQAPKVPRGALAKLIDSLPRPNRQDSSGRSWLSWAAEYGDEIVVEYFLKKKDVHPNQCDKTAGTFARTPVIWAAEKHHESLVRLMIEQRKDDFSLNYVIRHSKVYEGELGEERMLNTVKTLLSRGEAGDSWITERCDPEESKPLHLACYQGNEKIVDFLIEERAL